MITPAVRQRLEEISLAPVLLVASDYDGTLAPIVDDPARAWPDASSLAALIRIGKTRRTHAAVVSGRSRETLRKFVGETPELILIGSHGAETDQSEIDESLATRVSDLVAELQAIAAQHPGAEVEPKPVGAAFHFRNATSGHDSAALAEAVGLQAGAQVLPGKEVVELMLRHIGKGAALADLSRRLEVDATVFIGDDVTDEEAFAALGDRDVSIKVGPGPTAARLRVETSADVAVVLEVLESARRAIVG